LFESAERTNILTFRNICRRRWTGAGRSFRLPGVRYSTDAQVWGRVWRNLLTGRPESIARFDLGPNVPVSGSRSLCGAHRLSSKTRPDPETDPFPAGHRDLTAIQNCGQTGKARRRKKRFRMYSPRFRSKLDRLERNRVFLLLRRGIGIWSLTCGSAAALCAPDNSVSKPSCLKRVWSRSLWFCLNADSGAGGLSISDRRRSLLDGIARTRRAFQNARGTARDVCAMTRARPAP